MRVVSFVAAILAALLTPTAAHAAPARHTWAPGTTVCVQSTAGARWSVPLAIARWNAATRTVDFRLAATCGPTDSVVIRMGNLPGSNDGWTSTRWDGTGRMTHAVITFDPTHIRTLPKSDRTCGRRHIASHELGHALGLNHYPTSHAGNVMSYLGWRAPCGRLGPVDRRDLGSLR